MTKNPIFHNLNIMENKVLSLVSRSSQLVEKIIVDRNSKEHT